MLEKRLSISVLIRTIAHWMLFAVSVKIKFSLQIKLIEFEYRCAATVMGLDIDLKSNKGREFVQSLSE